MLAFVALRSESAVNGCWTRRLGRGRVAAWRTRVDLYWFETFEEITKENEKNLSMPNCLE